MFVFNLIIVLFILPAPPAHPVHVALTSIEYRRDDQTFDLAFKIFWDDLERVIAHKYNVGLKLEKPDDNAEEKKYLEKYIKENFRFVVNGNKEVNLVYQRKKINETAIWLYFKGDWQGSVQQVYIYNTVMMDMFGDQTDLVIFKYGKFEKGVSLTPKHHEIDLKVNEKL